MIKFPMNFEVQSSSRSGMQNTWSAQTGDLAPMTLAIPLEFKGPGGGYSPEDLFALSILNCMIAMFKVYSEKDGVQFEEIQGKAAITLDKIASENLIAVTHVDIHLHVTGASDIEKAKKIMDRATKDCIISNSIKSGKTFHIEVT